MQNTKPVIFHIDVNSAFLSWTAAERLRQGETQDLRLVPSVVGGNEKNRHGIVLAKSIPAKAYGIQTGEPLGMARRKCPGLIVVPPEQALYSRCSDELMTLLSDYSPKIEKLSIDECFLEYTGMQGLFGEPLEAAHRIRERVEKELGFTVNIGISVNRLLAKMASDFTKPNRVHTLYPEEIEEKMWPLPIEELYTVGRKTAPQLRRIGIRTIGDLAKTDPSLLKYRFKKFGDTLWQYANGISSSHVSPEPEPPKGIGASTTTATDVTTREEAAQVVLGVCETVSNRLRKHKFRAGLVTVSVKNTNFQVSSKQQQTLRPINATNDLYELAMHIFDKLWNGKPLRHLGVSAGKLTDEEYAQISIWDEPQQNRELAADRSIDEIRKQFGPGAIIRGSLLNSGKKGMMGNLDGKMFPAPAEED